MQESGCGYAVHGIGLIQKHLATKFLGHDAIVLSAFGCGRLHNPPESIARIFKQVIRSNYMGGVKKGRTFAEIVFAITNYESVDSAVNDTYNHDTFKRVMESPDDVTNEDEVEI